jgi:hypothetical protein
MKKHVLAAQGRAKLQHGAGAIAKVALMLRESKGGAEGDLENDDDDDGLNPGHHLQTDSRNHY